MRGFDDGEFVPFYQTQHDALSHKITGVEVLARWRHPQKGLLAPNEFLQAFESSGKAAELDKFMLQRALYDIRALELSGYRVPKVGFNISFGRLRDPSLITSLASQPKVEAEIAFELVESVFFDQLSTEDVDMVSRLHEHGIKVEIDDFGTGHASIVALTRLKPDVLKIDRALIAPLEHKPEQIRLVKAITDMAAGLDIKVLAEGVEDSVTINRLRMIGVNYFQGYAFSRPMSIGDLSKMLHDPPAVDQSVDTPYP